MDEIIIQQLLVSQNPKNLEKMSGGFKGYLTHFLRSNPKNKKSLPQEKLLIFREMKLSDSKIKRFLIFTEMELWTFQPKLKKKPNSNNKKNTPREFSYSSGNGNPQKLIIFFQKKAVLVFRETKNLKDPYISGHFLYFRK